MKAVQPFIASYGVPCLRMMSLKSHSTSGKKTEGSKERMGKETGDLVPSDTKQRRGERTFARFWQCFCVSDY